MLRFAFFAYRVREKANEMRKQGTKRSGVAGFSTRVLFLSAQYFSCSSLSCLLRGRCVWNALLLSRSNGAKEFSSSKTSAKRRQDAAAAVILLLSLFNSSTVSSHKRVVWSAEGIFRWERTSEQTNELEKPPCESYINKKPLLLLLLMLLLCLCPCSRDAMRCVTLRCPLQYGSNKTVKFYFSWTHKTREREEKRKEEVRWGEEKRRGEERRQTFDWAMCGGDP